MSKYVLLSKQEDGTRVRVDFEAVSLPEVLEAFEHFLRGSGFVFDGYITMSDEE